MLNRLFLFVVGSAVAGTVAAGSAFGQTITYNFESGGMATTSPTATSGSGVTGGAFGIGNSLGTVANPVTISNTPSNGYTTATGVYNLGNAVKIGAFDATASSYFTVTVTSTSAVPLSLTNFDFGTRSTNVGPQAYSLRSGRDNFASEIFGGTISNSTGSAYAFKTNSSSTPFIFAPSDSLELRLYTFGGTGSPGSGTINSRIDDVVLKFSPVPEPATVLAVNAAALAGVRLFRRRTRAKFA